MYSRFDLIKWVFLHVCIACYFIAELKKFYGIDTLIYNL